jgi:hypothetical protein
VVSTSLAWDISLDVYVIWLMGPSCSAGPIITEVSVWGIRDVECKDSVQTEWLEYQRYPTCKVQDFLCGVPEDSILMGVDTL